MKKIGKYSLLLIVVFGVMFIGFSLIRIKSVNSKKSSEYSCVLYKKLTDIKNDMAREFDDAPSEGFKIVIGLERKKKILNSSEWENSTYKTIYEEFKEATAENWVIIDKNYPKYKLLYLGEAVVDWELHQLLCGEDLNETHPEVITRKEDLQILQLNIKIEEEIRDLEEIGIKLRSDPKDRYRIVYKNAKEKYRAFVDRLYEVQESEKWIAYIKTGSDSKIFHKSSKKGPEYFAGEIKKGELSFEDKAFIVKAMAKDIFKDTLQEAGIKEKQDIDKLIEEIALEKSGDLFENKFITRGLALWVINEFEELIKDLGKYKNMISGRDKIEVEGLT